MADRRRVVLENVPGDFFVDDTCIDCDACRHIAPAVFGDGPTHSFVSHQPGTAEERRSALHALVSCPTGSIGTDGDDHPKAVLNDFPLAIVDPVYLCGFNSPDSFGGSSYFLRRDDGNWLVDSPKFHPALVRPLEELGGVSHIFLTHQDDVADAAKYAAHFHAQRIIHRAELDAQPDAEIVLDGGDPVEIRPRLTIIPTPGHTAGHCALLLNDRFLFTGDHLAWNRREERLEAFRDYCWYSWSQQMESMRRLQSFRFEWVLPGHGLRVHRSADEMQAELRRLLVQMET